MYNRRLCMYIQYVKKPLFLYFKCSKLIKSNNYHVIFYFLFSKCFRDIASWQKYPIVVVNADIFGDF